MKKLLLLIIFLFVSLLYVTVNENSVKAFQLTPFIPTNTPTPTRTPTPTIVILPWNSPTPTRTSPPPGNDCHLRYCTPTPESGNS